MRDTRGMHISNGPQWHVEDCLRSVGPDGAVTILHHLMRDDPVTGQHSDIENGRWYSKLRHGHAPQGIPPAPNRLIHVRMYHPNWTALDPRAWAQHTVQMLSAIDSGGRIHNLWDDPLVCVSPANEQNLHYECGDPNPDHQHLFRSVEHYQRIAAWNAAWADEVNRLRPNRRAPLCWPALAFGHEPPGHQPDGEYQLPEIRAAVGRYEIMATHPYALLHTHGAKTSPGGAEELFYMLRDFRPKGHDNPRDPGGVLAQFPDKPLLITECGTFTHADPARFDETFVAMKKALARAAVSGRVLGITWFIWHSDDAHPTNTIWPNERLRNALASLPPYPTTATVPAARVASGGATPVPPAPGGGTVPDLVALLRAEFGASFDDLRAALPTRPDGPNGPFRTRDLAVVKALAWHHTAGAKTATWDEVARGHLARDFAGIGYHFGIQQGRVAYLGDVTTSRANVEAQNPWVIGICVAGDYTRDSLDAQDLALAKRLVGVLDRFLGRQLPCEPHAKWVATACPGDALKAVLGSLRTASAPAPPAASLAGTLLAAGAAAQRMRLNKAAAIQKAIAAAGFVPTSDEFEVVFGGTRYVAQLAEHLTTGTVRVVYCKAGDWGHVESVQRP